MQLIVVRSVARGRSAQSTLLGTVWPGDFKRPDFCPYMRDDDYDQQALSSILNIVRIAGSYYHLLTPSQTYNGDGQSLVVLWRVQRNHGKNRKKPILKIKRKWKRDESAGRYRSGRLSLGVDRSSDWPRKRSVSPSCPSGQSAEKLGIRRQFWRNSSKFLVCLPREQDCNLGDITMEATPAHTVMVSVYFRSLEGGRWPSVTTKCACRLLSDQHTPMKYRLLSAGFCKFTAHFISRFNQYRHARGAEFLE